MQVKRVLKRKLFKARQQFKTASALMARVTNIKNQILMLAGSSVFEDEAFRVVCFWGNVNTVLGIEDDDADIHGEEVWSVLNAQLRSQFKKIQTLQQEHEKARKDSLIKWRIRKDLARASFKYQFLVAIKCHITYGVAAGLFNTARDRLETAERRLRQYETIKNRVDPFPECKSYGWGDEMRELIRDLIKEGNVE